LLYFGSEGVIGEHDREEQDQRPLAVLGAGAKADNALLAQATPRTTTVQVSPSGAQQLFATISSANLPGGCPGGVGHAAGAGAGEPGARYAIDRLGARSRTEAISRAVQRGVIVLESDAV
jgi:predicted methyltransferase